MPQNHRGQEVGDNHFNKVQWSRNYYGDLQGTGPADADNFGYSAKVEMQGESRTAGGDIAGKGRRFKATVQRTDPDGEGSETLHEKDYRTEYRAQKAAEASMKKGY